MNNREKKTWQLNEELLQVLGYTEGLDPDAFKKETEADFSEDQEELEELEALVKSAGSSKTSRNAGLTVKSASHKSASPYRSASPYKNTGFETGKPSSEASIKSVSPKKKSSKSSFRRKTKNRNPYNKKKGALFVLLVIFLVLAILLAAAAGTYVYLNKTGEQQLKVNASAEEITAPEGTESSDEGKKIVYNGKTYEYNENNINILLMGIDKTVSSSESDENVIGENGQADVLILASLDSETGKLSLINISRDSMVDVSRYNVEGQYLGTENMQICLAYSYGDGEARSCENTLQAVSRLMYGMPINAYMALDYSGIGVLNDAIGGVTVDVLEDLTNVDASLVKGQTVTLMGDQAETYVRTRDTSILESNSLRMERQKQYMNAFLSKALGAVKSNPSLTLSLYNDAADYMVTDLGASEVTHLATIMVQNGITGGEILGIEGELTQGEVYAEFRPDDEKLYQLILSVFYKEV